MRTLRIALAQVNSTVGDLEGNARTVIENIDKARSMDADIVVFPEMVVPGYPPEDLLLKPGFIRDNQKILKKIVKGTRGITVVIGVVDHGEANQNIIYNGAAVIHDGKLITVYHKHHLPNYGVFDEQRYFQPGRDCPVFVIREMRFGVNICEDLWTPEGPILAQAQTGDAQLIISINASPYHRGKSLFREQMFATRARDNGVFLAYINMVGGQDELIFDGQSAVYDPKGEILIRAKPFEEDLLVCDLRLDTGLRTRRYNRVGGGKGENIKPDSPLVKRFTLGDKKPSIKKRKVHPKHFAHLKPIEEVYQALVLGVRDYVRKNRFSKVVIGLSGGIDSSLTAVIATDALGKENVICVLMPSAYTSAASEEDSRILTKALGISLRVISIKEVFSAYLSSLVKEFQGKGRDVTEENIQARIRGNFLMALSNKFGWLVLTTGNKSEMSVGYATLYGDMAGGFAVIKDVPKLLVYELAEWRNGEEKTPLIPKRVISRPPSAELRPDQKDEDSLPPYKILDPIILAYVEEDLGVEEIVSRGFDRKMVERVIRLIDKSEYKRRQAPIGIKITSRAFGKDRRLPVTNRYRPLK